MNEIYENTTLRVFKNSCFGCKWLEYAEHDDGSETLFCHHDDIRAGLQIINRDCAMFEEPN